MLLASKAGGSKPWPPVASSISSQ